MPTKSRTFNLQCDTSEFVRRSEELRLQLIREAPDDVKYAAQVFANIAQKNTPPSIGKSTIEKKYYERPYVILLRLIRGGYRGMTATQQDMDEFAHGMIYKVINTNGHKFKDGVPFGYCKSKGQLKAMCRIATRGLMRVMWGKGLDEIGANVPLSIQRLLNKSPLLKQLQYSNVTLTANDDEVTLEIDNRAKNIEKIAGYAKAKALKSTAAALERRVKERIDRLNANL